MTTTVQQAATPASKHVRVACDLADKLSEICWFQRQTMADVLDPLIREAIERMYDEIPKKFRRPVASSISE